MLKRVTALAAVFAAVLTLLVQPLAAADAPPLVDADWVKSKLGEPGIRFVDMQGMKGFVRAHVPGAASTANILWSPVVL